MSAQNTMRYNRQTLNKAINEKLADIHWAKHHRELAASPEWKDRVDQSRLLFGLQHDPDKLFEELKPLLDLLERRDFDEETNERGNIIHRWFRSGAERYHWDFGPCQREFGWEQYDTKQDAWYFGIWVHIKRRLVLTYCEGDCTLVICPDDDHLRAELADAQRVYGDPPPAFITADGIGIDMKLTNSTAYYSERPTV